MLTLQCSLLDIFIFKLFLEILQTNLLFINIVIDCIIALTSECIDRNSGLTFSIWVRISGILHIPEPDENLAVGLRGRNTSQLSGFTCCHFGKLAGPWDWDVRRHCHTQPLRLGSAPPSLGSSFSKRTMSHEHAD